MNKLGGPNCIEIVTPLVDELNRQGYGEMVQLLGGVGSAALKHPGTEIFPDERRIVTSPQFTDDNPDLAQYRIKNGKPTTLRDVDLLVASSDPAIITGVSEITKQVIGKLLKRSVFHYHSGSYLERVREHPFGLENILANAAERYELAGGSMSKALPPFAVPLEPDCLQNWTLEAAGREFTVSNPAATVLNYLSRSISGLRPKDAEKVDEMTKRVAALWPDMPEWIMDGPGQSQIDLANIFQTLRWANSAANAGRTLLIGGVIELKPGSAKDLREHPAFMFADAELRVQKAVLAWAAIKSAGIGGLEKYQTVVDLWQKYAEDRVGFLINRG